MASINELREATTGLIGELLQINRSFQPSVHLPSSLQKRKYQLVGRWEDEFALLQRTRENIAVYPYNGLYNRLSNSVKWWEGPDSSFAAKKRTLMEMLGQSPEAHLETDISSIIIEGERQVPPLKTALGEYRLKVKPFLHKPGGGFCYPIFLKDTKLNTLLGAVRQPGLEVLRCAPPFETYQIKLQVSAECAARVSPKKMVGVFGETFAAISKILPILLVGAFTVNILDDFQEGKDPIKITGEITNFIFMSSLSLGQSIAIEGFKYFLG